VINCLNVSHGVPYLLMIVYHFVASGVGVGVSLLEEDVWLEVTVELALIAVDDMAVDDFIDVVCAVEVP
jgi:hypothetical protein